MLEFVYCGCGKLKKEKKGEKLTSVVQDGRCGSRYIRYVMARDTETCPRSADNDDTLFSGTRLQYPR